jgi:hypothetical protein
MDNINCKDVEEALNCESPQKKDLIKEVVKLKKQRSDFVDFVGWLINQTQYIKFNAGLNDNFLSDLDSKIDEVFKVITE